MKRKVVLAKIRPPVLTDVFVRKRLFHRLSGIKDKPLIWVTGPPGSGKTTLIASYLESRKLPRIWYRIDDRDKDPATFFYYFGKAVRLSARNEKKPLPLLTPEYQQGLSAFTKRYFESVYRMFHEPFAIVFDNYQYISGDTFFHEMVCDAAMTAVEGALVICISRQHPPVQCARMRANRMMDVIGWDELKLTVDESERFIRMNRRKSIPEETIRETHKNVDGWIAGLVLFLEGTKAKASGRLSSGRHMPEQIFHYFAKEILEKSDGKTRDVLLKTALFAQVSPHVARSITGNSGAGRILSELHNKNYFTFRYSQDPEIYEYHPLFRDFLLTRARDIYPFSQLRNLQIKAASIMQEGGQTEDAVELLLEGGRTEEVARLISRHAPEMLAQGRGKTVEQWLLKLPEKVMEQSPWLLYWLGMSRLPLDPSESQINFEKAFDLFRAQKDATGIFLSLSGVLDAIHWHMQDFSLFDRWISMFYELMSEYRHFPSEEIEMRVVSSLLSAFCLRQPHHTDFEKWEERALFLAERSPDLNIRTQLYGKLINRHIFAGDFAKASLLLNSFRAIVQSYGVSPLAKILLKDCEAFHFLLTARFEDAHNAIAEGIKMTYDTGVNLLQYILLGHGAAVSLSSGETKRAEEYLSKMETCLGRSGNWERAFYHFLKAWQQILRRSLQKASVHVDSALGLAREAGMPYTEAICLLGKSFSMHELAEKQKAEKYRETACDESLTAGSKLIEFMCLLGGAYVAIKKRDEELARAYLQKGMSLGREQGYVNSFLWTPAAMTEICMKALESGIEVEYVQNIIRGRNLIPEAPPIEIENWPWPIRIYTLGRFGILKDGKPLHFGGKVQQRPLMVLKALIACGGREISEERIIDILWPEAEGDAAHSAFTTTLSRLRQIMGSECAVTFREKKISINQRYCWVDVWAFERILGKTESLCQQEMNTGGRRETGQLLEKAIKMYTGPFLSGDHEPWLISLRERLRNKFLRSVRRLGLCCEQEGEFEKAVQFYQRGLDVDDLAEEFYQDLMRCYQKMGRRAEALSLYRQCSLILSTVLRIKPSPETEALKAQLMKR